MFASKDLTAGQLNAIVKKLGGKKEALRFLRGELKVVDVALGKAYELLVDFNKSIEELVDAGEYDYASSEITFKHFCNEYCLATHGREEVTLYILSTNELFDEPVSPSSDEVLKAMGDMGFKPAGKAFGIHPLLTLGIKHPDEQRKAPIVDLGSTAVWQYPTGNINVPMLWGDDGCRGIDTNNRTRLWSQDCRFAAVQQ